MGLTIATNVDSIKIQNILSKTSKSMSKTMERMSTGLKINSASDDAAGTVISSNMQVQLEGNQVCQSNIQNASAMLSTAEGNLGTVEDNLVRIRNLTLQAKNGTYSTSEIQAMQDEVEERIAEINRVSESSKYSEIKLFGDEDLSEDGVIFQVGANADSTSTITAEGGIFASVRFSALTGRSATFDLTKMDDAAFSTAIGQLDTAVKNVTSRESAIGSVENRLDSALETLTVQYENLSSAKSVITDADIAEEASKYTQDQILEQISLSLLSQANSYPSYALSLI